MKKIVLLAALITLAVCLSSQVAMFAKLKGGRVATEKTAAVPFSLSGPHLPVLEARLNGTPVRMVVDTGGVAMIDSSLCVDLKLEPETFGNKGMTLAKLDSIAFGEMEVLDMKAVVLDFKGRFKMDKFGIRGMIGSDLLRLFQTEIDYAKRQFTFSKPERMEKESAQDHLMGMDIIFPYLPFVDVAINGGLELKAIVDTGVQFGLVIPYPYLERGDIPVTGRIVECEGMFASWPLTEQNRNVLMKVDRIRIGDIELKDQTVLFADLPKFGEEEVMLLGMDFLNDYRTRLDFENLQVRLREAPYRQEDIAFSIGANLVHLDDGYDLKGIWKGSPAESQELKVGDKFSHVNGRDDISGEDLYWMLVNPQVKELSLTEAASGKVVKLAKKELLKP
jgi:hypothetical protein